jgi:hypothetical protein
MHSDRGSNPKEISGRGSIPKGKMTLSIVVKWGEIVTLM